MSKLNPDEGAYDKTQARAIADWVDERIIEEAKSKDAKYCPSLIARGYGFHMSQVCHTKFWPRFSAPCVNPVLELLPGDVVVPSRREHMRWILTVVRPNVGFGGVFVLGEVTLDDKELYEFFVHWESRK